MKDIQNVAPQIGWLASFLLKMSGMGPDMMEGSPPTEVRHALVPALLQGASFTIETAAMTVASIRLFAHGDVTRYPVCFLGSTAVAGIIGLLDHYTIVIPGVYEAGWAELARGGLVQEVSVGAHFRKAGIVLVRLAGAAAIAQVTTFALLVPMFGDDISARILSNWQKAEGGIVGDATAHVDAIIKTAGDAVTRQQAAVNSDTDLVTAAQQTLMDPVAAAPSVVAAGYEVAAATESLSKANAATLAAQTWSADELAGAKGNNHSGKPGDSFVHKAADAKAAAAAEQAALAQKALTAARQRLTSAEDDAANSGPARSDTARQQLPGLRSTLENDTTQLATLQANLTALENGRSDAITHEAEKSPGYQPLDEGLLSQFSALEQIVRDDPANGWVVDTLEFATLTLELGLVLARSIIRLPSRVAAKIGRETYLNAIAEVDAIERALANRSSDEPEIEVLPPDDGDDTPDPHSNQANGAVITAGDEPRRPRGRPRTRKSPFN